MKRLIARLVAIADRVVGVIVFAFVMIAVGALVGRFVILLALENWR